MRAGKTVEIDGKMFELRELTVRDVWDVWTADHQVWVATMMERCVSPAPGRIYGEALKALWQAARDVNVAVCGDGSEGGGGGPRISREELTASICRVIRAGHGQAWDYGWSVFLIAAQEAGGAEQSQMQRIALAVRMGYHAPRSVWAKFMRPSKPLYGPRRYGNSELAQKFRRKR